MPSSFLLVIDDDYRLCTQAAGGVHALDVLRGGAVALLGPRLATGEGVLEAAIATAEDWLMPHAPALRGALLQVEDRPGRLGPALDALLHEAGRDWTVAQLEQLFLRMVDLATGRHPPVALQAHAAAVADLLLLRELAHHGQVAAVRIAAPGEVADSPRSTAPGAV